MALARAGAGSLVLADRLPWWGAISIGARDMPACVASSMMHEDIGESVKKAAK